MIFTDQVCHRNQVTDEPTDDIPVPPAPPTPSPSYTADAVLVSTDTETMGAVASTTEVVSTADDLVDAIVAPTVNAPVITATLAIGEEIHRKKRTKHQHDGAIGNAEK